LYLKTVVLAITDLTRRSICATFSGMTLNTLITGLEDALNTTIVGHPIQYWATIGSTMDEARRLAETGAPEGTVVVADEQRSGRGRLERSWWAPPASSLLLSILFRPPFAPLQAQRLTMICSLAACDAILGVLDLQTTDPDADLSVGVKWPNDVLIGERKICGILTELEVEQERLRHAIVGIGINVNMDFQGAPPLTTPATSLSIEAGHPVSRRDLLIDLLTGIEQRYLAVLEGRSFHQEWAERMVTLGHPVQVSNAVERWTGEAVGVDKDGALLVRRADRNVQHILAGDVTLRATTNFPGSSA
jgi:BirA family biotin operon repressor/biotin-[acetyl-CoA-carboxylase] ligase